MSDSLPIKGHLIPAELDGIREGQWIEFECTKHESTAYEHVPGLYACGGKIAGFYKPNQEEDYYCCFHRLAVVCVMDHLLDTVFPVLLGDIDLTTLRVLKSDDLDT